MMRALCSILTIEKRMMCALISKNKLFIGSFIGLQCEKKTFNKQLLEIM